MIKIPYLKETAFGENVVFDGVKGFLSQLFRGIADCSSPRSLAGWCFCIGWWRIAGGKGCCSISAWHFGARCWLWWSELWSSWPTYTAGRLTALQSWGLQASAADFDVPLRWRRNPAAEAHWLRFSELENNSRWADDPDVLASKSALWLPAGAWEVASWMSTTSWW